MKLRVLSASDIDQALSMIDVIDINAQAYAMLSAGEATMPSRVPIETEYGATLFMPAYLHRTGALAVKVVSVNERNCEKGLPTIHAIVLALDSKTGRPLAIMDGTRLTALRTGAASGVATRLLAREDARILAMFGAGGQAMSQIEAVLSVRKIEEVRTYTPSGRSARQLADQIVQRYPNLKAFAVDKPARAVCGADIINCATTSHTPVFDPADVDRGTHINGVGSFKPEMREVQVVGLPDLRVFVDSRDASLDEAGDLIQAISEGHIQVEDLTEIGKVILGETAGRTSPDEITFFKSVGVAVQDAATAQVVLARSIEMELGEKVEM